MKRVLFLDDDRQRTALFRQLTAGIDFELTAVETADECIARLAEESFDVVFLDHDLGGEIYCDSSREDCGMEVVRWLERNGGKHGFFIIHTHNEVAGAMMYFKLERLEYAVAQAPFGSGEFRSLIGRHLGRVAMPKPPRRTIGDRLRDYFRSLRLGR